MNGDNDDGVAKLATAARLEMPAPSVSLEFSDDTYFADGRPIYATPSELKRAKAVESPLVGGEKKCLQNFAQLRPSALSGMFAVLTLSTATTFVSIQIKCVFVTCRRRLFHNTASRACARLQVAG